MRICASALLALLVTGWAAGQTAFEDPPAWAQDAIWYQIFVERFRNGDPSNDPTLDDMDGSWPHMRPDGWAPTPWTQDWYRQEPWAEALGEPFYLTVQLRRFGGDLQGVLDQLDHVQSLGVTALYLNPINDAPSLHKFDARNYRHVDRNFGPDPDGDARIMAAEDPADPSTWQWTAADRQFLELIDAVHARGMRIILDFSWNHTGITFWAWNDLVQNQRQSPYADWYSIDAFDDPSTPDTSEFAYTGWMGVRTLPELAKVNTAPGPRPHTLEGDLNPGPKAHVYNVTRRWMDPNGDGDPSDGIDGFRLDVAEKVPLGFWRDYRHWVRSINPDAYLVGEVWWESWPERMSDPVPWVQGDVFDAVMNYRWYMPTRSFFAGAPPHLNASEYVAHLDSIMTDIPPRFWKSMMNLAASHDTPRISTSLFNHHQLYKYRMSPRGNPEFLLGRPAARTRAIQTMVLVQQYTWPGAPHIWNGDELGMWGGDDPDPRKPLMWPDLTFEDEAVHPQGQKRGRDVVAADLQLLELYQELGALRHRYMRLWVDGAVEWHVVDSVNRILVYSRSYEDERAVVVFNAGERHQAIPVPGGMLRQVFPAGALLETDHVELPPLSARVYTVE